MLIEELEQILEEMAPKAFAEPWDNVGLLVGRRLAGVQRILVGLDLTEDVLVEAVTGRYQAIITHHPLMFAPLKRITDRDRVGVIVNQLIAADVATFACHTNLDGAPGGLCELVALELGLTDLGPLVHARRGWKKLVGFVPPEAVESVADACFKAGAGQIGAYHRCAFEVEGVGGFVAQEGARPAVGRIGRREAVSEVRWETVVPEECLAAVVQSFIATHPYEEPAFDIYPVEDEVVQAGQGRVGRLRINTPLASLVESVAEMLRLSEITYTGPPECVIDRVAVVTGSGGSLMEEAARHADLLITGDLRYHDAERAEDLGLALICAPHYELESWALRQWTTNLEERLASRHIAVKYSDAGRNPWKTVSRSVRRRPSNENLQLFGIQEADVQEGNDDDTLVLRIDGGSRGNPGPSAIGVVVEDSEGNVLEEVSARIGTTTNNVAEYQALITGLETALDRNGRQVRVLSDSELLVKQMRQEYRVRDPELKELYLEAVALVRRFAHVDIKHVPRAQNAAADTLVNKALDGRA
ncbi:MAG: Nif3-like dinuclear metal center hexameric protein [Actinobacteria bacterium]|nr:Nif3-like dinuclear metal center hexameric protein [Actinomycetota bacterium]